MVGFGVRKVLVLGLGDIIFRVGDLVIRFFVMFVGYVFCLVVLRFVLRFIGRLEGEVFRKLSCLLGFRV